MVKILSSSNKIYLFLDREREMTWRREIKHSLFCRDKDSTYEIIPMPL